VANGLCAKALAHDAGHGKNSLLGLGVRDPGVLTLLAGAGVCARRRRA
jgi:hypothetical protein